MLSKSKPKYIYTILNIAVSFILLFIIFGNIIKNPNYIFFSKSGDGLKSTFGSYYHLQYDTTYWHTESMNYPYGESVFFTGNQPLIINLLKILKSTGVDLSQYMTGILNIWLLLGIVWASLFLFLLLRKLKLPWWYAIITANIITFLSPQMARFGGHFNLAYLYFLPLFLYLLKLFFDKPSYRKSLLIGLISFLALGTQAYFFAEASFWIFFLLLYGWIFEKKRFGNILTDLFHLFLQIGLPFIIFNLFTISAPSDRTVFPWGFFEFRSSPEAVFLPFDKPYARFIHFSYLKWEGMAFIGMVASITFLLLLYRFFKAKFQKSFTGNKFLDAILLGAVIALFISFAYPFQWGLQWTLKYTGPFRQFRAIGRFNWLFFYSINVIAFYWIWQFYERRKNRLAAGILVLALLWGTYDAYLNVRGNGQWLNNRIEALQDSQNKLPQNLWLQTFNAKNYQAIMVLPYFHIGSEVYWIGHSPETEKTAFIVSWKTGLPLLPVMLSRTSISQTIKNLGLYFEPLRPYAILKDFPNSRDLLLIRQKKETLNKIEQRYLAYAIPLYDNKVYSVYRLPIDSLKKMGTDFRQQIANVCNSHAVSIDSLDPQQIFYQSFGNPKPDTVRTKNTLNTGEKPKLNYEITFLFKAKTEYRISFWLKNMNKDLWPRSVLKINILQNDNRWHEYARSSVFRLIKYVNARGWGLVEMNFTPKQNCKMIRLELWNNLVTSGGFDMDELLIYRANDRICYKGNGFVYLNNRFVKR